MAALFLLLRRPEVQPRRTAPPNRHSERSDPAFSRARLVCAGSRREESLFAFCAASASGLLPLFLPLKIKMPMPPAPRIKPRPAPRTPRLALQIFPNRHVRPASPAQNRPLPPFPPRPNRNRMPRQRNMTILASIVDPATPHLDRHNIRRRVIVRTPRLRINLDPAHRWRLAESLVAHRHLAKSQ